MMAKISVTKENLKIGAKVIRGKDWDYGNQDVGTIDSIGIIVELQEYYRPDYEWCTVKWSNGNENAYEIGKVYGKETYSLYYLEEDNRIIYNYLIL